jgi:hypothetical protein
LDDLLDHSEEDEELRNQLSGIIKSIATKKISKRAAIKYGNNKMLLRFAK